MGPYRGLRRRLRAEHRRARHARDQVCKCCGRTQNEVDFTVSTREWEKVVPARWRRWAVCLACFERFAAERGRPVVKVFLVDGP